MEDFAFLKIWLVFNRRFWLVSQPLITVIRTMIATLQKWADKAKDEYGKRHHLRSIESLASQIKDAKLFEKTRIASWEKLNSAALIDIAQVYLESGDVETAHSWLKKIPEGETYQAYERDKLLEEIYQKQGDTEKLTELLFQKFRSHHSTDTLQALLDVIGHDKRDEVVADEVKVILKADRLRESDAEFLIAVGKIDEAELYLLKRADQLDGNHYGSLLSLAEAMEAANRYLVTSLMYRSLLISILERGYTKAYPHGIRSYMEWSGGDFDRERFDTNSVNWEMMKYLRWSRDRYQNWGDV